MTAGLVISQGPTHRFCTFNNTFPKSSSTIPTLGADGVFVPTRTHTRRKHSLPVSAVFNKQSGFLQILFHLLMFSQSVWLEILKSHIDTRISCECVYMNNNCSTSKALRARLRSVLRYCIISAIILTFPLTSNTSFFLLIPPDTFLISFHLCLLICRGQMI